MEGNRIEQHIYLFKFKSAKMKSRWLFIFLFVTAFGQICQSVGQQDCGACENTYFFDGKCLPCGQARDQYSCELCKGFYYRQGQCLPCSNLTNPGLCKQCRGYFFSGGECKPCQLASPYLCTIQCPDYYLKRGVCSYCGTATDQLTCKFCPAPFQFKEGKCRQCPKHYTTSPLEFQCMACAGLTNSIICSRCPEFYFANNTCSSCRNATDARQCSFCADFYFQGGVCKHCSEAGKKDCVFCKGFVLQGQECVACKLVNNSASCQNCPMYRFSTDRDMCVPCQQKGYFLNEQGYCQHCLTAYNQQTCDRCPRYFFNKRNMTCIQCSQLKDLEQCVSCVGFYFNKKDSVCEPCANASMLNCIIYCDNRYFYSRDTCKSCEQAKTQSQCKNCASNHFWSESGKCIYCLLTDFYPRGNKCASCSSARTSEECKLCPMYTFSNGICKPCRYAINSVECSNCRRVGYYFTSNNTCNLCNLASQESCNPINCPRFGYHNGSCVPAATITTEAGCLKFQFFSWTKKQGCQYCAKSNQYLNPVSESCIKCQHLRTFINCSRCLTYYFDDNNKACLSCTTATTQQSCNKCVDFAFVQNRRCIPCGNLTKQSDCAKCPTFIYRRGECTSCSEAISREQCKLCPSHAFQDLTCKRCEQISNMAQCQNQCGPQGYFPAKSVNLCLPCSSASDESSCSLCIAHIWDQQRKLCLNCSQRQENCRRCAGMYWNTGFCKLCPSNCNSCSETTCLQCKPSFSLSQNRQCQKVCNAQFCHKCAHNSSDICEECKPDFDFSGSQGICSISCMVARCLTCKSNSICQTCENGYMIQQQGQICRCSIQFCDSCEADPSKSHNNSIICNRCMLGYALNDNSGACSKVDCQISNCQLCRTEERCNVCKFGWKLTTGICQPICNIQGCSRCSSAITCELCQDSFKLANEKFCQPICNISNCKKCGSGTTCIYCKEGYELKNRSANCIQICMSGFYNKDNMCLSCSQIVPNCQDCQLASSQLYTCKKCQPSFALVNSECASCTFVTPNCINCVLEAFNFVCLNCTFGYSPINKRCRKCADNCVSCEDAGEGDCDTCIDGYAYSIQAVNHIKCIPCMNNCKTCKDISADKCTSCYQGQLFKDGNCLQCSPNCKKCLAQNTCQICREGYLLGKQGCLFKKIPFCKTEIVLANGRSTDCLACHDGYFLFGGSCLSIACTSPEDNCTACPYGKYLSSGQCLQCPSIYQCQTCNPIDPSRCSTCMRNYYLQSKSGQCYLCMTGCDTCASKYNCQLALPGYYLLPSLNITVKCPFQCATCTNDYFCSSCANGYRLYRKKCISSQSFSLNITLKPTITQWDSRNASQKLKTFFLSLSFFQAQIAKLIGYDGREEWVYFDSVTTGSIIVSLIIDILPSENEAKAVQSLERSINRGINTLKVVSFQIGKPYSKEIDQQNSSHFIFAVIGISTAIAVCLIVLAGITTYFCRLRNRVALEPAKVQPERPTYTHIVRPELENDHSSDKDSKNQGKGEEKSEEPTENLS